MTRQWLTRYPLLRLLSIPELDAWLTAGQEIHVKFEIVTPNAKIPPDRFTPPAEVKQLMTPAKKSA